MIREKDRVIFLKHSWLLLIKSKKKTVEIRPFAEEAGSRIFLAESSRPPLVHGSAIVTKVSGPLTESEWLSLIHI